MEYRLENIKIPVPRVGTLDGIRFETDILCKFLADTSDPSVLKGSSFNDEWFVTYKLCDGDKSRTAMLANTNDYVFGREDKPQRVYFTGTVSFLMYKGIHLATYSYEQSKLWIQYNWEGYDVTGALQWLMALLFAHNNVKKYGCIEFNNIATPRGLFKTGCILNLGELTLPSRFNNKISAKGNFLSVLKDNIVLYGVRYTHEHSNILKLAEDDESFCAVEQSTYIDGGEVGLW